METVNMPVVARSMWRREGQIDGRQRFIARTPRVKPNLNEGPWVIMMC